MDRQDERVTREAERRMEGRGEEMEEKDERRSLGGATLRQGYARVLIIK